MRLALPLVAALGLGFAPTAGTAAPGDTATARFKGPDGADHGTLTVTETPRGLFVAGRLTGLPPGPHGFHLHATGDCTPPFKAAGGHFNPMQRKHGFLAPDGQHAGDMPNVTVEADGTAAVEAVLPAVTLTGGATAALDADGAALMLHAGADDHHSDPAGASGDRIACGVLVAD